jgi:hypothetical protein
MYEYGADKSSIYSGDIGREWVVGALPGVWYVVRGGGGVSIHTGNKGNFIQYRGNHALII